MKIRRSRAFSLTIFLHKKLKKNKAVPTSLLIINYTLLIKQVGASRKIHKLEIFGTRVLSVTLYIHCFSVFERCCANLFFENLRKVAGIVEACLHRYCFNGERRVSQKKFGRRMRIFIRYTAGVNQVYRLNSENSSVREMPKVFAIFSNTMSCAQAKARSLRTLTAK